MLARDKLRPWLEGPSATTDILHTVPPELHSVAATAGDVQLRLW